MYSTQQFKRSVIETNTHACVQFLHEQKSKKGNSWYNDPFREALIPLCYYNNSNWRVKQPATRSLLLPELKGVGIIQVQVPVGE